jgi:glycosyltransferase involved in cell wall biosynthesis
MTDEEMETMTARQSRTLIVSWHWPPTNRASAGVLGTLFASAPGEAFRVVTRSFAQSDQSDLRHRDVDLAQRIPQTLVHSPTDDQPQGMLRGTLTAIRTVSAMVREGCKVGRTWKAERVMAIYPHRLSMLAGWRVAKRLRLPLVLYMHDLCAEAMTVGHPLRRKFWRMIDRMTLRDAHLVIVPTEEFASHYRERDVSPCWVLPHCTPPRISNSSVRNDSGEDLRLVYSGAIYEPHEDAARSFIEATRSLEKTNITYLAPPDACGGLLGSVGAKWVAHSDTVNELENADVFVVLLGKNTPCPEETHGCFPSKIVEYLAYGRPILAVVPKGCFVDRLISASGCGITVTNHDRDSIRNAIDRLRDPKTRSHMGEAARRLADDLRSDVWMPRLMDRLRTSGDRSLPSTVPNRTSRARRESNASESGSLVNKRRVKTGIEHPELDPVGVAQD